MRTFLCSCGQQLFFDNSICLNCKREAGWCPVCRGVHDLIPIASGLKCGNPRCNSKLVKCDNYIKHFVCNRCIALPPAGLPEGSLCDCCSLNKTIPDLSIEGNRLKWARLEAAKRRMLYALDMTGLPYGSKQVGVEPELRFDFKANISQDNPGWVEMADDQKVYTGHNNGLITINIDEADDAVREKLRVTFKEAHRSLLGHFRHEFGHYIWDVVIKGKLEDQFIKVFGDHNNPLYDQALKTYYERGAPPNWGDTHISAYATMHAWEDFAETFARYLDMISSIDSAMNNHLIASIDFYDFEEMITTYKALGIAMNEMNRSMGLLDFLPEIFVGPVKEKMWFIHQLTRFGTKEVSTRNGSTVPLNTPGGPQSVARAS